MIGDEVLEFEAGQSRDPDRRARVLHLALGATHRARFSAADEARAGELVRMGFKALDALHLASAERADADWLLTTDDRLVATARRREAGLCIRVGNPLDPPRPGEGVPYAGFMVGATPRFGGVLGLMLMAGLAWGSAADVPPNPLEKPGWVLDARDEFDGPTLNTNLWSPYYLESRTARERATARYQFRDGCLVLFVDADSRGYFKDGPEVMTVSAIQTGDRTRLHRDADAVHHEIPTKINYAPLYGYFEVRARLPDGAQSAFWTLGIKDGPMRAGEIDIFESIRGKPRILKFVIHTWGDKGLRYESLRPELEFDSTAGFHIYALEWNEGECVLYIDNRRLMAMAQAPRYPSVFLLSLYGNTRDHSRREFCVDYFRAYKREGQPLTRGAGAFRRSPPEP